MALNCVNFESSTVWDTKNPSNLFGYHHGPYTNPNPGWVPPCYNPEQGGSTNKAVSIAQNDLAPNPSLKISSVNTGIDINMQPDVLDSACSKHNHKLRRHFRDAHPGAVANTTRQNITVLEHAQGQNAIRKWVLNRDWHNANYVLEPGCRPANSFVD
ncbi:hypothetical protein AJ80_10074 [Polytolypa hystricis UAMH7299]|uniref:Uncharacterized protein n=1 Tax=Polytolypa hystricis (strain UAMH7299) TaxID=1447883 RepID=A0A2B7WEL7_POLH7|nr:hypothetical protein AJ80_10074 [Polytolypa hystricis UAMH7299]